ESTLPSLLPSSITKKLRIFRSAAIPSPQPSAKGRGSLAPPFFALLIDLVERVLEFLALRFEHFVRSIRRNVNRRRDDRSRSRKWLRRLKTIPALLCFPKLPRRNREWQNWIAGLFREQDSSHLGDVTRAFRAIDGKGRRTSSAHQPHHLHDRSGGATR